jgi:hypothetical protein
LSLVVLTACEEVRAVDVETLTTGDDEACALDPVSLIIREDDTYAMDLTEFV